jgi:hypothetical protein
MGTNQSKLKSVLQKSALNPPPIHFTTEVMEQIDAMSKEKIVFADLKLKKVLQQLPLSQPSAAFTHRILQQVQQPAATGSYLPPISKRAWSIVAVLLLSCLVLASPGNGDSGNNTLYFGLPGQYLTHVFARFAEPLLYCTAIVFSICLLLTFEHLLTRHRKYI